MKVVISAKRLQDEKAINEHIKHRLSFAFSRTRRFIRSIEFILSDIQGPKGGVDKECKVIVEPESSDAIVIVERQSKMESAIDRCITRASRNFIQQRKRKKHSANLGMRSAQHDPTEIAADIRGEKYY